MFAVSSNIVRNAWSRMGFSRALPHLLVLLCSLLASHSSAQVIQENSTRISQYPNYVPGLSYANMSTATQTDAFYSLMTPEIVKQIDYHFKCTVLAPSNEALAEYLELYGMSLEQLPAAAPAPRAAIASQKAPTSNPITNVTQRTNLLHYHMLPWQLDFLGGLKGLIGFPDEPLPVDALPAYWHTLVQHSLEEKWVEEACGGWWVSPLLGVRIDESTVVMEGFNGPAVMRMHSALTGPAAWNDDDALYVIDRVLDPCCTPLQGMRRHPLVLKHVTGGRVSKHVQGFLDAVSVLLQEDPTIITNGTLFLPTAAALDAVLPRFQQTPEALSKLARYHLAPAPTSPLRIREAMTTGGPPDLPTLLSDGNYTCPQHVRVYQNTTGIEGWRDMLPQVVPEAGEGVAKALEFFTVCSNLRVFIIDSVLLPCDFGYTKLQKPPAPPPFPPKSPPPMPTQEQEGAGAQPPGPPASQPARTASGSVGGVWRGAAWGVTLAVLGLLAGGL